MGHDDAAAAAPERRVFDGTIAEQAQLAVLLRRLRHLEVAMSDPVNAHINLAVGGGGGGGGGTRLL